MYDLPSIRPGVFPVCKTKGLNENETLEINQSYAKNYQIIKDIIIIFKALKSSINLCEHIDY